MLSHALAFVCGAVVALHAVAAGWLVVTPWWR